MYLNSLDVKFDRVFYLYIFMGVELRTKGRKSTIRSEIKLTAGFNMKLQNYNRLIL